MTDAPTTALTPNAVRAISAKLGWDERGIVVRRHPRSGRSRLLVASSRSGRSVLFKQGPPGSSEPAVMKGLGPQADLPDVEFVSPDLAVIATEFLDGATSLHALAQEDPAGAIRLVGGLGPNLSALHGVRMAECPVIELDRLLPRLDPLDGRTWAALPSAAIELVKAVQRRPLMSAARDQLRRAPGPLGFIHGDLKLDNILMADGLPKFIDWELAGVGPIGYDLGALFASILGLWLDGLAYDHRRDPLHWIEHGTVDFGDLIAAADGLVDGYRGHELRVAPPSAEVTAMWTSAWLVDRALAEVVNGGTFDGRARARLLTAEGLLRNPGELFSDAWDS